MTDGSIDRFSICPRHSFSPGIERRNTWLLLNSALQRGIFPQPPQQPTGKPRFGLCLNSTHCWPSGLDSARVEAQCLSVSLSALTPQTPWCVASAGAWLRSWGSEGGKGSLHLSKPLIRILLSPWPAHMQKIQFKDQSYSCFWYILMGHHAFPSVPART